jgi:hypothetical protein
MPTDVALTEQEARKQARKERAFYAHLAKFAVVMSVLLAINLLTSPGYLWVVWPLLGWGVGLASHGFGVFGRQLGGGWVERRTADLMGAEASEARLRALLDETLDARALPAGKPQDLAQLQRRIEHLEAIVTATGDPAEPVPVRARDAARRPLAAALDDPFEALPSPIATPRFDAFDEDPADDEDAGAVRQRERA